LARPRVVVEAATHAVGDHHRGRDGDRGSEDYTGAETDIVGASRPVGGDKNNSGKLGCSPPGMVSRSRFLEGPKACRAIDQFESFRGSKHKTLFLRHWDEKTAAEKIPRAKRSLVHHV